MLNPTHDAAELSERYRAGDPFPHIVLDDFLDEWFADQAADELETVDVDRWLSDNHSEEVAKCSQRDLAQLPPVVVTILKYLNSPQMCAYFSELTGIPNLLPDPSYYGGGAQVTFPGGHLGVHADFNLHPATQLHRRVNALLYLNRGWESDWGGQFELWPADMSGARHAFDPIFNRMAVFSVSDTAFHGVPKTVRCPQGRRRLSVTAFYYTEDRPDEEKAPFHWAAWQQPVGTI